MTKENNQNTTDLADLENKLVELFNNQYERGILSHGSYGHVAEAASSAAECARSIIEVRRQRTTEDKREMDIQNSSVRTIRR